MAVARDAVVEVVTFGFTAGVLETFGFAFATVVTFGFTLDCALTLGLTVVDAVTLGLIVVDVVTFGAGFVTSGLNVDLPIVPRTAFTGAFADTAVDDFATTGFVPDLPTTCAASTVPKLWMPNNNVVIIINGNCFFFILFPCL